METEKLMDEIDLILQTSKAGTMSTSVSPTVSEYMTFYIKDYALYTETEKFCHHEMHRKEPFCL